MVQLRKIIKEDCDILFQWANDIEVRKSSFNCDYIVYQEHVNWFLKMLQDENILFFIMEADNKPIGQVRVNIDNNIGVISYSICKECRSKGFGKMIIQLAEERINSFNTIDKVVAHVKKDNKSSNRIFMTLNYLKEEYEDKNVYYKFIRNRLKKG